MRLNRLALAVTLMILAAGCETTQRSQSPAPSAASFPPKPARLNHLVFFKLKDSAQADELIADCDRLLATIPGVVSYFAGTHLDTGRGDRVDGNYDVGFYVGFDDEQAYAAYVDHPSHIAAVNKWRPRWEWIRIHDVIDR